MDGIIIGPGPGSVLNEGDVGELKDVMEWGKGRVPILGVCLGMQLMHVHGSSEETADDKEEKRTVEVMEEVKHGVVDGGWTRYHSYGCMGEVEGEVLEAWDDGVPNRVVFRDGGKKDFWGWGIQGHPESVGKGYTEGVHMSGGKDLKFI